ncbi:MAG: YhhA family cyclophane-containing RiPP [Caulobacteraceae bacterium]
MIGDYILSKGRGRSRKIFHTILLCNGAVAYDMSSHEGELTMADGSMLAKAVEAKAAAPQLDVPLDSPAIRRLIEEVRAETVDVPRSYNRTFNRHNR